MRRTPWATYLWPGLPEVWTNGSLSALGVSALAAALLNLALLASLVWSELLPPGVRNGLWLGLAVGWVAAAIVSRRRLTRRAATAASEPPKARFEDALGQYLQGNWFEAERVLSQLLQRNAADVDARLMLATLLRHTRRLDEAAAELQQIEQFEGAAKWQLEIQRERALLERAKLGAPAATAGEPATPAGDAARDMVQAA